MTEQNGADLVSKIGEALPYLRRYARALTGAQERGDHYAAATLETILGDPSVFDPDLPAKVSLFKVFHSIWNSTGATFENREDGLAGKAQAHLAKLTPNTREALLLHTIEELSFQHVGETMDISADEASQLVQIAFEEMSNVLSGRVMIIEDEAIIAMDLEGIVTDMGHVATGIARTEDAALSLFDKERPDLILSDIQLADNSSGIDAAAKISAKHPAIPVIFITAYPERLLTGEGSEPAFLISKPYTEDQVRSAISQAMFFSSTETLKAG